MHTLFSFAIERLAPVSWRRGTLSDTTEILDPNLFSVYRMCKP